MKEDGPSLTVRLDEAESFVRQALYRSRLLCRL